MLKGNNNFTKKKVMIFLLIFILTVSVMQYSPTVIRFLIKLLK
jgi:hypothetical protein